MEADNVSCLLCEAGIVGASGPAPAMRPETTQVPQTPDGAQRDADGLWRGAARPIPVSAGEQVRRFAIRFAGAAPIG